uniref:SH2 domain-containing protein n=1 Tax=Macrostomum lignano TaxID=282301 RepID=A0A1I8F5F2_9PLAT
AIGRTEAAESRNCACGWKANSNQLLPGGPLSDQKTQSRPEARYFESSDSLTKPLKEIYLSHLTATGSDTGRDRLAERIASFDGPNLVLRSSDPQQPQPESYPLDSLAYIDLVLFHTVKGRKRHFGYFRRHSDSTEVVPDSVLIPLHKKDHRLFLECHVYQLEAEQAGLDFIREIDSRSEARQAAETRSQFSRARPEQQQQQEADKSGLNKWASQPLLLKSSATRCKPPTRQPASRQAPAPAPTVHAPLASSTEDDADADEDAGPIRRTASGTIFDKYKELQVFNIPEYEYMGFQELQEVRRSVQERRQQRQQQQEADNG